MHGSKRLLGFVALSAVVLIAVTMILALPGGVSGAPADAPQAQATAPQRTPFAEDDLARIKKAGKIMVGTSADYPPFEYYNEKFEFEGFDIELMNLIAKELGVTVEYKDFAFEGLGDALKLGQVDAVIAALSITPERAEVVDFSNIYYVGNDAILARRSAPINDISDLKSLENLPRWCSDRIGLRELDSGRLRGHRQASSRQFDGICRYLAGRERSETRVD